MLLQVLLTLTIVAGPSLVHSWTRECQPIDNCEKAMKKANGYGYTTLSYLTPVAEELPSLCPGEKNSYTSCMSTLDTSQCVSKVMRYTSEFIKLQFQLICANQAQLKDDLCASNYNAILSFSKQVVKNCGTIHHNFNKMRRSADDATLNSNARELLDCVIGSVAPCGTAYKSLFLGIKNYLSYNAMQNYYYASSTYSKLENPSKLTSFGIPFHY